MVPAVNCCRVAGAVRGVSSCTAIAASGADARDRLSPSAPSALKSARVALRKRFGQHLLKNPDVVANIVAAARLQPHETVFEIGPGTGNMTVHLLAAARLVYAAELDPRMAAAVRARVDGMGLSSKFRCVNADFLKVPLPPFDALVANIPYQISSPVLTRLFAHTPLPRIAVIMFQKEFAERMVARPGTASYCRLSVNTALLSSAVSLVMTIDRRQFRPPPKVDSAVIALVPRGPPAGLHFASWDNFLRTIFSGKNKTLRAVFQNKNIVARLLPLRVTPLPPIAATTISSSGVVVGGGGGGGEEDGGVRTAAGRIERVDLAAGRADLARVLTACGASDLRANGMPLALLRATYDALEAAGWRFAPPPAAGAASDVTLSDDHPAPVAAAEEQS